MASITAEPNGRRTLQFKDTDGSRKSIRLGKCDQKTAQAIRTQIELLASAKATGTAVPRQTAEWLRTIDESLRDRIAAAGLIEARKSAILGEYIDAYVRRRVDAKPRTIAKWNTTKRLLSEFLGECRDIRTVSAGDADGFKLHLTGLKKADGTKFYSPSTLHKHIEAAKLFFKAAVRDGVASENPFGDVTASKRTNPDREHFISHADIRKCIDATADNQVKLILALSRFGGLRTPSEHVRLRWQDILWDQNRMIVHSPKTEHHEGMASRVVPIFPELRPFLDQAFEQAAEGEEFVVTRIRDSESNLRTLFQKIIKRAGLTPWPKLFQNLRASRQTELENEFPTHVVCKWMGNSPKVAQKHYLQVLDEHFEKAVQNPVQQAAADPGNASHSASPALAKTPENAENSGFPGRKDSGGGIRTPDTRTRYPPLRATVQTRAQSPPPNRLCDLSPRLGDDPIQHLRPVRLADPLPPNSLERLGRHHLHRQHVIASPDHRQILLLAQRSSQPVDDKVAVGRGAVRSDCVDPKPFAIAARGHHQHLVITGDGDHRPAVIRLHPHHPQRLPLLR